MRIRVLLVEDRADDAELVVAELMRAGFDVDHTRVQDEVALGQALDRGAWDVILSDFAMPAYDGLRAFEMVRSRAIDVPFIFVSGALGEERAVDAMRAGARDYILKGNLRRLPVAVRRELDEAQNRRDRRSAEAALVRSERRYRSIFDSTSTPLLELDLAPLAALVQRAAAPNGEEGLVAALGRSRVLDANAAALSLFAMGTPDDLAPVLVQHLLPMILQLLDRARRHGEGGRQVDCELRITRPDGSSSLVIAAARVPLTEPDWDDVVLSLFDVTDRRALEARLHTAERLEAVGRLAGGLAHDFNNLLTIIGTSAQLVRDELAVGDPKAEDVDVVLQAVENAAGLTNQLLAFSRKRPQRPELLDLNGAVDDTQRLIRRLIGESIVMDVVLGDDLPPVQLDPVHLEQVIMNLCTNGRDAMPDGGTLSIRTSTVQVPEGGRPDILGMQAGTYVVLEVRDTGIGMDEDTRLRVFEPFFTSKAVGKGTGLGLATVHGIVEQSGGHIELRSAPGQGSRFRLYFPARIGATPTRPRSNTGAAKDHAAKSTILLVEDEDLLRAAVKRLLERGNYHVLDARDGDSALKILADTTVHVDMLITDVVMPGMRGHELARRAVAARQDLRVLFISGYHEEIIARDREDSLFGLLGKPFTGPALLERVRMILDAD